MKGKINFEFVSADKTIYWGGRNSGTKWLRDDDELDDDNSVGEFGSYGMLMVVDGEEENSDSGIISHSSNSHTLAPSIAHGPDFSEFKQLQNHYLIDFAGMFDDRGGEIEIAIDIAL